MSSLAVINSTKQLINVQEFTGQWKIKFSNIWGGILNTVQTPLFSPLCKTHLKFYFEINCQYITVKDSITLFKFRLVKKSYCEIPSSLKMKMKCIFKYYDGFLFTNHEFPKPVSVADIDSYNFPDIKSLVYEDGQEKLRNSSQIDLGLSLICEMIFFDEFGSSPVNSQNTHFLRNIEKVNNNFSAAYNSRELSDVVFNIGDKTLRVNRFVLAVHSPVFKTMFSQDCVESETRQVTITDATFETFDCFLKYLYCGKIEDQSFSNVRDLYVLGDKYDVQVLKEYCIESMTSEMSVDRVCEILKMACLYNDEDLEKSVNQYVSEHMQDLISDAKWEEFVSEYPQIGYNMAKNFIKQNIK